MFQLHEYQQRLVDRVRQAYTEGFTSPCVVAPCGAGKSIMISEIARMTTNTGRRVLFVVHRKELIDQIRNTFIKNEVNMSFVEFGMVQTVVRRLDKTPKPALIITDESHHGLAASYRKIYEYFDDVLRLSFTATPIRLNGSGLGDINDILIEEVDAEWLIQNGFLSPYKYYAPKLIDTSLLKLNNLREFSCSSMDKALESKTIYGDVVEHYRKLASGEQAICYCHNIESSKRIRQEFLHYGIVSEHIDAKTPKLEREEIVTKFRNKEIQVLTNVDLIGEGFDVPDCSTVIMLRPTQSLSLYIQQSMRGMRYKPAKTSIIIDHVDNVRRFGLPDQKRYWSLSSKKKLISEAEIKIKQCTNCFAVYPSRSKECPECRHKPEIQQVTEYERDKDATLEEVTKEDVHITLDFREPSDCKNMKELYELAKHRNYKRGWAYYQGKQLGFI
ncbi:DEAD/DEAH box helicase [Bacillus toyonensis]|uniref:DEAD/DEAH box helicase n=1 Tax=Bacillus toyonensis TaxID=155322 RepID=UPI000BF1CA2D|nr:DEAD/DEAH box helicase [Bacillus toyonensis]PEK75144.1 helicase [Bacillus toyonensis]PEO50446.1 helicase [Bacillus toyonensis]PFY36069.1 helicase [Bacillus toyonensis]PFY40874.1 helicase [Bacillus toyonensis]PFY70836.1 helicase [Bacillus toyonensis]